MDFYELVFEDNFEVLDEVSGQVGVYVVLFNDVLDLYVDCDRIVIEDLDILGLDM